MLTPVSMELSTPPLQLKIPRAVATTVWPSSSSSSSSRALGLRDRNSYRHSRLTEFLRHNLVAALSFLPHRNGLGHRVDIVVLVFGAVVHGAGKSVQTTVMVCVLRLWRHLWLHRADALALFQMQECPVMCIQ